MNDAFTWLTQWLMDVLLLGSALLLLGHAGCALLRQPAQRMTLAWGVLLGLLLLILLAACPAWPRQSFWPELPAVDVVAETQPPVIQLDSATTAAIAPLPNVGLSPDLPRQELAETQAAPTRPLAEPPSPLAVSLFHLWSCGAALALGWIALGAWQAVRLLRRSHQSPAWAQQELAEIARKRRQPQLRVSPGIATAVALGASRPHILLPAASVQPENAAGVRAALSHEWAHIRHGDLWLLALERLLLPVFFWHPLFWLFRRRIRFDQELLADAAAAGEQPVEYAEALLAWAKSAMASPARPPLGIAALSLWENPRSLSRRVEMVLQANKSQLSSPSRPWRFVVLTSMLAAVLGLSLFTLRPTASAQDEADRSEIKQRKPSAKKKRNKLNRDEKIAPAAQAASDKAIELSLQVLEVDQHKLAEAELSSDELIVQTTGETCQMIDGVIVAANDPKRLAVLLARLRERELATVISSPRLITLDQQEAKVHIGGEVPLVKVEETANGQSKSRVEYKNVGMQLTIKPSLSNQPAGSLALDVLIECSRLLPPRADADAESASPVFKTRKMHVVTDVEFNQAVLIAEPQPKRDHKLEPQSTLLVVIAPAQVVAPAPITAAPPATAAPPPASNTEDVRSSLAKLHAENDELRKQVAQLHKQLADAQVQLAWLRDAATVEGREKVSDEVFLRRVYLDLLGLPPTAEEAAAFLEDSDANKRKKLIDRLLGSAAHREQAERVWGHLSQKASDSRVQAAANPNATSGRVVKIFALKDTPAKRVMEVIEMLQKQEGSPLGQIKLQAVAPDERTNSIIVAGKEEDIVIVGNLITDLEKKLAVQAAPQASQSDALAAQLRALDVREAEINLRAAQTKLERIQSLASTNPSAVSQQELTAAQFEAEKAALELESLKSGDDPLVKQKYEVRMAMIQLRAAQATVERLSTLIKQGGATQTELDVARFEAEKAEIEVERAKARATGRQK